MLELPRGARLSGYTILSVLGKGGMGVVYEAEDAKRDRRVALKVVSPELAARDDFLARFRREGRAQSSVLHENVVALLETGEERGMPFLVFELVPGGTLAQAIKERGRLPWREAAALGTGIARGLAAIHAAGLVHRDLKPENVLLASDREGGIIVPKVADFGLVGAHAATLAVSSALTRTGELLGTLAYMSPEQANGQTGLTASADLYSLGAVLHAALTGSAPFEGTGYGLVKKHLLEKPRPPSEIAGDVPETLDRLVLSLLEKRPDARPRSAKDVARALDEIARTAPPARSRRWIAGAVLALLLLLAAGTLAVFLEREWTRKEARRLADLSFAELKNDDSYPSALEHAEAAIALDDGVALAWYCSGRAHDALNDVKKETVLTDFSRALELDPTLAPAWSNRGTLRGAQGDLDGSIADLSRAIDLKPDYAAALTNRSTAYRYKGDFHAAIEDATKAIEIDPKLPGAWAARGMARLHDGKDFRGAVDDLTRAIERESRQAILYSSRGEGWEKLGEDQKAIADYTKAIQLDAAQPLLYRHRGTMRENAHDLPGAIADYTRAIELDPTQPVPYRHRGVLRQSVNDDTGAIADFTKAIELDSTQPLLYRLRGVLREKLQDREGALADYTKAIELDPKDSRLYELRGDVSYGKNDWEGALADYTKAIDLGSRTIGVISRRAKIYWRTGHPEKAVPDMNRLVEYEPMNPAAWRNRGGMRSEVRDWDGAILDYTRAIELEPSEPHSYAARAHAHSMKGNGEAARADCKRYLEFATPTDPDMASMQALDQELNPR